MDYNRFVPNLGGVWSKWYRHQVVSQEQLDRPNPSPHSCQHCAACVTDLQLRPSQNNHVDVRRQLPVTKDAVLRGVRDNCPLFMLLLEGYRRALTDTGIKALLRALENGTTWDSSRVGILSKEQAVVYLAECLGKFPFQIRMLDDLCLFATLGWASNWLLVSTEPDSSHSKHFNARPIQRDVLSTRSILKINRWLNECLSGDRHAHCSVRAPRTFTPTRLVEIIDAADISHLRLFEPATNDSMVYCCLSYCWGGDQPFKTKKANRTARMHHFDTASLPLTIRDAIEVTARLGQRYLWVDSLCIVQDDDEDKSRELAVMADVYTNAVLTISASNASTCQQGFLRDRSYIPDAYCEDLVVPVLESDGKTEQLYLTQRFEPDDHPKEDPVNSRAWILQERMLSRRLIDFGTRQVRWYCNSWTRFDGGRTDIPTKQDNSVVSYRTMTEVDSSDDRRSMAANWMEVVESYTQRIMSVSSDKLIAMSAMATVMAKKSKMIYAAGLWREHLVSHLLWQRASKALVRPQYRAPSWSWACIDSAISYSFYHPDLPGESGSSATILDCHTDFEDAKLPFGRVSGGSIILEGYVRKGRWYKDEPFEIIMTDAEQYPISQPTDYVLELEDQGDADLQIAAGMLGFADTGWTEVEREELRPNTVREVALTRDAIETDLGGCWTDEYIDVRCLELLHQDDEHETGSQGLILIDLGRKDSVHTRRIGHFDFAPRKRSLFEGVSKCTITIY